jgi:hypothetical protein
MVIWVIWVHVHWCKHASFISLRKPLKLHTFKFHITLETTDIFDWKVATSSIPLRKPLKIHAGMFRTTYKPLKKHRKQGLNPCDMCARLLAERVYPVSSMCFCTYACAWMFDKSVGWKVHAASAAGLPTFRFCGHAHNSVPNRLPELHRHVIIAKRLSWYKNML